MNAVSQTHMYRYMHTHAHTHTHIHIHAHKQLLPTPPPSHAPPPAHPLNLDHPYVEHECGNGGDDDPHPAVPVAQVGRDGDATPLPQTGPLQPSVHPCYDATVTKGNDVGGVVVKTV